MVSRAKVLCGSLLILALLAPTLRGEWQDEGRPPAPDFQTKVWLNSTPLTLKELRGKVVLIDFWEYTCINCIRTFPYLRRWNALYGPLGLVVIGVHTPEFDFAKDPARVADATRRFKFTFPIAVDSDRRIWDAFNNDAWPAKYLIDKDGRIAYSHLGEGDYAEFERHIQQLLKEANPKLTFASAKFDIPADSREGGGVCQEATPETYLGFTRGDRIANQDGYKPLTEAAYQDPGNLMANEYALSGRWLAAPEYVRHVGSSTNLGDDYLDLKYRAKTVYLVAGSDDGSPKPLYVTEDGKPLPKDSRGVDVKIDSSGRTYIELGAKRMYYVVNNPHFEQHTLRLSATAPAISLYSFTFGNECENAFDHS